MNQKSPSFIMLIGLPGSGKSHIADLMSNGNRIVISSDSYREKLYGNESIQGDNSVLFAQIEHDIIENLNLGYDVILDAVNIWRKHRVSLLQKIPVGVWKEAVVVATQYGKCLERNAQRERVVPEFVLDRMVKSFQVPTYTEGFDFIDFIHYYNPEDYSVEEYLNFADGFDQENHHHSMTLGGHSRDVGRILKESGADYHVFLAGLLHDCGKPFTKVFHNMKGEPSDIAHYYSHENRGTYEAMFYLNNKVSNSDQYIEALALINYHMRPYMSKTEKAVLKLKSIMGDSYNNLCLLHDADKRAH